MSMLLSPSGPCRPQQRRADSLSRSTTTWERALVAWYHIKGVEAGKRCSDLLHHLGLVREELLHNSRLGKNLLDLLGSSQVSSDIRTLHSQRALHQEASFPSLRGGDGTIRVGTPPESHSQSREKQVRGASSLW